MASDIFAKIGDIKGESLDAKHKDEIEVLSWSWGVPQTRHAWRTAAAAGRARRAFSDLHLHPPRRQGVAGADEGVRDRRAHQGSDDHRAQGRQGPAGIPDHQDERHPHHQRSAWQAAAMRPRSESVTLQFAKVDLEYKPQKADGSLDAGLHFKYDIKAQQGRRKAAAADHRELDVLR